jgi:hypothetical protein
MNNLQAIENAVSQLSPEELAAFRAWFEKFETKISEPHTESFNADEWTHQLTECLWLELLSWRGIMSHDTIRAFAISCYPWHDVSMSISFLTDRESLSFKQIENKNDAWCAGKWSIANWRMFNFTSGPDTHWPYGAKVMAAAHKYFMEDKVSLDTLLNCCANALKSERVMNILEKHYTLSADFELYAGHPDKPGYNYCTD